MKLKNYKDLLEKEEEDVVDAGKFMVVIGIGFLLGLIAAFLSEEENKKKKKKEIFYILKIISVFTASILYYRYPFIISLSLDSTLFSRRFLFLQCLMFTYIIMIAFVCLLKWEYPPSSRSPHGRLSISNRTH